MAKVLKKLYNKATFSLCSPSNAHLRSSKLRFSGFACLKLALVIQLLNKKVVQ